MKTFSFDSTLLNNLSCNRKANYFSNLNLQPREGAPSYFDYGELGHYLFRIYYQGKYDGMTHTQCLIKAEDEARSFYSQNLDLAVPDCEEAIKTAIDNLNYWQNDSWYPKLIEQPFAIEVFRDESMQWPDGTLGLRLIADGVIDLIIINKDSEEIIIDHKFISRNKEPDKLSYQFMLYCLTQGKNKVIINHVGKQKTLKPPEKFTRHIRHYSSDLLSEFHAETVTKIIRWIKDDQDGIYLPEYTSCDKYAGCQYRRICETEPKMRENIIQMYFKKGEAWSPFNRR